MVLFVSRPRCSCGQARPLRWTPLLTIHRRWHQIVQQRMAENFLERGPEASPTQHQRVNRNCRMQLIDLVSTNSRRC